MKTTQLEKEIIKVTKNYQGIPVALSGGIDSSLLAALIKPKLVISVQIPGGEKYNEIEYSSMVAQYLGIPHYIVVLDENRFEACVKIAVGAIGRPIPHFNIFPLFYMYEELSNMGYEEVILGDGPDEVMSGYARDLIMHYLYKVYDFEAFENYKEVIDKILPLYANGVKFITGQKADTMIEANILARKDMDDMSDGIAKHFGIRNIRPYQDDPNLDNFMRDLTDEQKVYNVEYGKYALRKVAEKYLPKEIAWRKKKVGGPVYPVNIKMGWDKTEGEFGKNKWLNYQKKLLV